jgi:hypothetical protein
MNRATERPTHRWFEDNQRQLMRKVRRVAAVLEAHGGQERKTEQEDDSTSDAGSALESVVAGFGLSDFERDILLMCAGIELDARFPALCAAAQGDLTRPYPTFGLALAAFGNAHWSAVSPSGPLRRWRLVEVNAASGTAVTQAPLRIDERVLHHLTGVSHVDERVSVLLEPLVPVDEPAASQRNMVSRIAAAWSAVPGSEAPVIQIWGGSVGDQRSLAAAACAAVGLSLRVLPADALPTDARELAAFNELWFREAVLAPLCLLVDCNDLDAADRSREAAVARLLDAGGFPVIVTDHEPRAGRRRTTVSFEVRPPGPQEQRELWRRELGEAALGLNGQLNQLVSQFNLTPSKIKAACSDVAGLLEGKGRAHSEALSAALWNACRVQARLPLDGLAQRVHTEAAWEDLVLPAAQSEILREIAIQVRHRFTVYEEWGFGSRTGRGLGITALFSGPSGTGKTLAAEVLANRLHLDLYRIDLSQVVNKYIGETEKNLRRVFDAAQQAGACLLFDEADALFGRRSEVKDSHDRYANIEVGYLLQRMEAYRGLAILTTNAKESLDTAFHRRLRFVVDFPFPDASLRAEIWRRIFPRRTPTEGLDVLKLARLDIAGGSIRNIALQAAFFAADDGDGASVEMRHLLRAAGSECAKIGTPLTPAEVGGWV